jgi:hypothetical protein
MDSQSISGWLQDKALWVTLLGLILPPISAKLGVQLSADKIAALVVMVVGYVAAHKLKSGAILLAELKAKALAAVTDAPAAPPPALGLNQMSLLQQQQQVVK